MARYDYSEGLDIKDIEEKAFKATKVRMRRIDNTMTAVLSSKQYKALLLECGLKPAK